MDDVNIIVPIGHDDGVRIAEALEAMVRPAGDPTSEVTSLDGTPFAVNSVDAVGIPTYVSDVTEYSRYGLTETGWYVFARIKSGRSGVTVTDETTVEGAAGYIAEVGTDHIDVAVHFDVAAQSQGVTIDWGDGTTDALVFRAGDLAVRNLDYRVTFFVYDAAPFATVEYALTTDTTFAEKKAYFTRDGDAYTQVPVTDYTIGDAIPADTYYVHSKIKFEGLTKNVTYRYDTLIDCPTEFVLPEVDDDEHGCWYEIRLMHAGSYSMTLTPPTSDVKVATQHTQAETEGINMVDLHYTSVVGNKVWRFMNTHSTFTADKPALVGLAFRTPPEKVEYVAGEALDTTGAVVVATYEDGHSKIVTPTFAPANGAALTADVSELVASYTEEEVTMTASTPITVTGGE